MGAASNETLSGRRSPEPMKARMIARAGAVAGALLRGHRAPAIARAAEHSVEHPRGLGAIRHERLIVAVCLVLGGLLRSWDLSAIEFKNDEQEALTLGIRLLDERPWSTDAPWPRTGLASSTSIANPPLFAWIMALFWAATGDAVRATALVAFANWLCLFPLYLWARRRIGPERSLMVLAVLCVSPFAVLYSRKLWAQDLLLPALTLLLWGVEWMRDRGTFWRGIACVVWAALPISQLHQSGPIVLAVALPAALVQWIYDRQRGGHSQLGRPTLASMFAIVVGAGAFLFFWVPYLGYVMSLPPEALTERPRVPMLRAELFRRLLFQLVPRDLVWFFGGDMKYFLSEGHYGSTALVLRLVGYYGACVTGVLAGAYGLCRWAISPLALPFVGIWWLGIILAFTLGRIPSYPHYVLILAPLPALLISGAFDPSRSTRWLRWMRWVRWGHVASLALLTTGTLLWVSARGGSSGDYGVTYRIRLEQARAIAEDGVADVRGDRDLACGSPRSEIRWLLSHRLGAGASSGRLQLCEGWRDHGTHREYVWALRR